MDVGATYQGNGRCRFSVWAPSVDVVELHILSPKEKTVPLERNDEGYWTTALDGVSPDTLYEYRLNKETSRPDPASHYQPQSVHKPSQVVDHSSFQWEDNGWKGIPLDRMVMYELHVGTFTPEGTFASIVPRLDDLKAIGITAIELMPVAQFPGTRNWGYDGVYPYAVQNSYGGPSGLKAFVNECHRKGMAVILDVVYNHLGPEGNYLANYGPYFTAKYRTPWGMAVNFDGPESDHVRNYFIENALLWFREYHLDALRLDAVHAIFDNSAYPFLAELTDRVQEFSSERGRNYCLIAESNLNDTRIIRPRESFGFGLDAQWCDDFHHSVHTLLTGENDGYYADFGKVGHLVKCLKEGYTYSGEYSKFRRRRHGNSPVNRPPNQFIVCTKNHDQIGNRVLGDRMSTLVSFEALKLHAAVTILSPFIPLIFMGEEYAEDAPFLYFVSHSDRDLIEAVRKGRREEFRTFDWKGEPPDPQSESTFNNSRLDWSKRTRDHHQVMLEFYKHLISLRRELPGLSHADRKTLEVTGDEQTRLITLHRRYENTHLCSMFNFNKNEVVAVLPKGLWRTLLDSAGQQWNGPGPLFKSTVTGATSLRLGPFSASLFVRE